MPQFTADTVGYGGNSFDGVTFDISSAYQKQTEDATLLSYHCTVTLATGEDVTTLGWGNIKGDADFNKSPFNAALADAKARVQAVGGTNIEDV
jgi:predicted porin